MKNRSVQAISIGLSAFYLAGPVSLTAYAQTVEETPVPEEPTQQEAEAVSEEAAIADSVSNVSEQLNTSFPTEEIEQSVEAVDNPEQVEQQIAEISEDQSAAVQAVDTVGASMDNVSKATEAIQEANTQAEAATTDAKASASAAKESASQASTSAAAAVNVFADETLQEADAAVIIANTDKTVTEAQTAFNEAESKYNTALEEYTNAKNDYDTALASYKANKEKASSSLKDAQTALTSIQTKLDNMQQQLDAARKELAEAGVDALLTADDNKSSQVGSFVSAVLQYYYVPNSEKLSEGQSISEFQIIPGKEDANHLQVSYDIIDSDNKILRTVTADYGYTVDSETGEVQLFTKDLIYQYVNAQGQVVTLSKDEVAALGGNVEIGEYWVIQGYYIPVYKEEDIYYSPSGELYFNRESVRINSENALKEKYQKDPTKYKTSVTLSDDWTSKRTPIWGWYYDVTADYTVTYNKTSEKNGYVINKIIAGTEFASEKEAKDSVIEQAIKEHGAYTIDMEESRLETEKRAKYAELVENYLNGEMLWRNTDAGYMSYVSSMKTKITAYDNLIQSVKNAKDEYNAAKEKLEAIQARIDQLGEAKDFISLTELVRLDIQLENAAKDYNDAKDNLQTAKESLLAAKDLYKIRFQQEDIQEVNDLEKAETELAEIEEELEEELKVSVTEPIVESASKTGYGNPDTAFAVEEPQEIPVDEAAKPGVVTIPEDKPPLAITMAGLVQRGKWFVALAGVSTAGAGVGFFEIKRRAAAKIIDKLNQ